jgi:glutathione S-transferase
MLKLIGMLDSPFVRRTAIALECLAIPFEHDAISVFTTFEQFRSINPVVKAPSLVCDDGTVLMDSSLILQYAEAMAQPDRSLLPRDINELQQVLRIAGLALAACEKGVQRVYEQNLRPAEAQYEPWIERVTGQLLAACAGLEHETQRHMQSIFSGAPNYASIVTAVSWRFLQMMLPELVVSANYPALVEISTRLERLPEFIKYPPVGPGVVRT